MLKGNILLGNSSEQYFDMYQSPKHSTTPPHHHHHSSMAVPEGSGLSQWDYDAQAALEWFDEQHKDPDTLTQPPNCQDNNVNEHHPLAVLKHTRTSEAPPHNSKDPLVTL